MTATVMCNVAEERAAVVAEARSWLNTPFHHRARIKGVGVDCIQLVIASYVAAGAIDEPDVEPYPADWFLHQDRERILERMGVATARVAADDVRLGDLALFTFGRAAAHAAIVVETQPAVMVVHSLRGFGVTIDPVVARTTPLGERLAGYWTLRRWSNAERLAEVA